MILFVEIPRILFPIVVIPVVIMSPSPLIVTPSPTFKVVDVIPVVVLTVDAVTTPTTLTPDSLVVTADPTNVCSNVALVASRSPVLELNVRLVPVLAGKFPVAPVANKTLHVVSDDSSASVMLVALVAVPVTSPVTSPVRSPTYVVAVTTPV